ncbi:MAG: surface lipoprotein assembly modifier [Sphingomicrobium sp.]
MLRRAYMGLLLAAALGCAPIPSALQAQPIRQLGEFDPATERAFLDGMTSYAARDYRRAEVLFRQILDRDPGLLRVRLELARTLFMEKKDEQADYHFRLAAGEHPPAQVTRNIVRFREAIRARRAWRFNFDVGFAPDSNINSATDKQTLDIYGLPFRLDPTARARSGTGTFAGGDASIRLNRFGSVPIYLGAYGRWLSYRDHDFDDAYAGAEAGPEFQLPGGRLRTTATGLMRWYGERPLVTSLGTQLDYEKLVGDKWTVGGKLLVRHNDYARRRDVDGWDAEARVSAGRPLGPATLAFAYLGIERSWANDPGQAFWREALGIGIFKEIGWGLRPQLAIDLARRMGDGPLAPFGRKRRDWLLQGSFSIYKRDWNVGGFAPSLSLTTTRNFSTVPLYYEKRVRGEIRLTKAF